MVADSFCFRPALTLIGLCLGASSGFAQSKPITYSSSGGSAKQVLADLSAKTGLKLQTNPQTQSEFLYINVQNIPRERLLEEIAWSVWGSWKNEGDTYTLVRTDSDRVRAEREARTLEAESFRSGIAARKKKSAALTEFTAERADKLVRQMESQLKTYNPNQPRDQFFSDFRKVERYAPIYRALARLSARLTPAELAEMPTNIPVVYSNFPTAMERPFGKSAQADIERYFQEEAVWRAAAQRGNLREPKVNGFAAGIPGIPQWENPNTATRLVLKVTKYSAIRGTAILDLYATTATGEVTGNAGDAISAQDFEETSTKSQPPAGPVIKVSGAQRALFGAISNGRALDQATINRLVETERTDPLALFVTPLLDGYCRAKRTNLVAALPDMCLTLPPIATGGDVPVDSLEKFWRIMSQSKVEEGVISWRPIDLSTHLAMRSDRRLLSQYLKRNMSPKGLTLEERSYWHYRLPLDPLGGMLAVTLSNIVQRSTTGLVEEARDQSGILKLLGSLSPDQRQRLWKGEPIFTAELTAEQAQILFVMTYGFASQLTTNAANGARGEVQSLATELLPDGISLQTRIAMEGTTNEVVYVKKKLGDRVILVPKTATELAWYKFSLTRPDLLEGQLGEPLDLDQVYVGSLTRYNVSVSYDGKVSQNFSFEDRDYRGDAPVSLDKLPSAFLRVYQETIKRLEESAKKNPTVPTPVTTNPPPPSR